MQMPGQGTAHTAPQGSEVNLNHYEYFTESNCDQYTFYRIPKLLFTDAALQPMSYGAKILYGILLDRVSLSIKNRWIDENGHVYIIYTLQEIMETLGICDKTATKLMNELMQSGLVERRVQGLGRPALLYVKNFATGQGVRVQSRTFYESGVVHSTIQDSRNLRPNNTENIYTNESETNANTRDEVVDPGYRFTITPWQGAAGDHPQGRGP